ncbi:MAG: low temperature requirement protein A [Devosia sp.]
MIHAEGRRATWFELFFDLVFVTAVAGLAGRLSEHYGWVGAAQFTFLFLVLWWLWLGHTFHASRFDRDRPDQWVVGFAQMVAVVFIAFGAADAFGYRAWAFAAGVAGFKLLLMLGYLREIARPGLRRLCILYSGIYAGQAALWAGSLALGDGAGRTGIWALALALDVITPFVVARETYRAPPHPEHLPERFSLFTIILLGETAAAAVHAFDHGTQLHRETIVVGLLGAALGFLFWVGYFNRAKGAMSRHVADAATGRQLRLWAYAHIPLNIGIASIGAGTVYLAHHNDPQVASLWLFSIGSALAMVGVTVISLATAGRSLSTSLPYVALAIIAALTPLVLQTSVALVTAVVILATLQVSLSLLRSRLEQSRNGI